MSAPEELGSVVELFKHRKTFDRGNFFVGRTRRDLFPTWRLLGSLGRFLLFGRLGAELRLLGAGRTVRSRHWTLREVCTAERGWNPIRIAGRATGRPADTPRNHLFFVGILGKVQDVSPMEILLLHSLGLVKVGESGNVAALIVDLAEQGEERRLMLAKVRQMPELWRLSWRPLFSRCWIMGRTAVQ